MYTDSPDDDGYLTQNILKELTPFLIDTKWALSKSYNKIFQLCHNQFKTYVLSPT